MKRFHVHIAVNNIQESVDFYSKLFGQSPSKQQSDYAKWMLEDPKVNFAISARGHALGLNHLGFQVETTDELAELKQHAQTASAGNLLDDGETACCYANSEKHWTLDPQGLAWEHFLTLSDALTFGEDNVPPPAADSACCVPMNIPISSIGKSASACCVPNPEASGKDACCE
jgi:catechol 2,3-dioxygenase-like lactoylglutathione lyase family enzyme